MPRANTSGLAIAIAGCALLGGCGCPPASYNDGGAQPRAAVPAEAAPPAGDVGHVEQILAEMAGYTPMTDEPVSVNPELFRRCAGVGRESVERAAEEHGPHAFTRISVSMNPAAAKAFRAGKRPFPEGSVIVKHKDIGLVTSGAGAWTIQPDGIGGMIKRAPGYDPGHGDWEYFYVEREVAWAREGAATFKTRAPVATTAGKLATCIDCHANAADRDYVFGTWQNQARGR